MKLYSSCDTKGPNQQQVMDTYINLTPFTAYSGKQFNELNEFTLLKCLTSELKSPTKCDYAWTVGKMHGLKQDESFIASGSCKGGGLYFTDNLRHLSKYVCGGCMIGVVQVPDDAQVFVEIGKAKSDKLFLKEIMTAEQFVVRYIDDRIGKLADTNEQKRIKYLLAFVNSNTCEMLRWLITNSEYNKPYSFANAFYNSLLRNSRHAFNYDNILELSKQLLAIRDDLSVRELVVLFENNMVDECLLIESIAKSPRKFLASSFLCMPEFANFDNQRVLRALENRVTVGHFIRCCAACKSAAAREILLYSRFVKDSAHASLNSISIKKIARVLMSELDRNHGAFDQIVTSLFVHSIAKSGNKPDAELKCKIGIIVAELHKVGVGLDEVKNLVSKMNYPWKDRLVGALVSKLPVIDILVTKDME